MAAPSETRSCPHCGEPLKPFELADNEGWADPLQYACFNDDCPYYREGWAWMWEHYAVKASYRYRVDSTSGLAVPIPVPSPNAFRDRIVPHAHRS